MNTQGASLNIVVSVSLPLPLRSTHSVSGPWWDRIELSSALWVSYYSGPRVKEMKITMGGNPITF